MLTHTLDQRTAGHSPLLVLSDPLQSHRQSACSDLLDTDQGGSVLVFAYNRRPRVVVDSVTEHGDPDTLTILSLAERDAERPDGDGFGPNVTVDRRSASNLTGIGVDVSRALKAHDDETELSVCLGSLTTLLQYVDTQVAFKFLHVTLGRLDAADGTVHAHLDPDAVDEETVATLATQFDSVLERSGGGWTVRST